MKIKICGIKSPEDASFAAKAGASMIGMLFWKGSRNYITTQCAKEIVQATHEQGALAVGVFVDETLEQIQEICHLSGIDIVQLHGPKVHSHFKVLKRSMPCILVVSVDKQGQVDSTLKDIDFRDCDVLYDHAVGGTGDTFDWKRFVKPLHPWILAGGLTPDNVAQAICMLNPMGVDVSSGVENSVKTKKDKYLIEKFIEECRHAN